MELTFMQKKQKVVEIKKSQEELAALKQVLSTNHQQIKEIDENIKLLGNYTFLLSHTLAILATRQKIQLMLTIHCILYIIVKFYKTHYFIIRCI